MPWQTKVECNLTQPEAGGGAHTIPPGAKPMLAWKGTGPLNSLQGRVRLPPFEFHPHPLIELIGLAEVCQPPQLRALWHMIREAV